MADEKPVAYRVAADASFPQAIRKADELADGTAVYETVGRNYSLGSYILASELTPRDQERAENGDLSHLLAPASMEDALAYRAEMGSEKGVFIPEHSAEAVVLSEYGHQIVPREQVIEMKSAGAEAAREAQEAARADIGDARNVGSSMNPNRVDATLLTGVQMPPGIEVGADKAMAEGASEEDAQAEAEVAADPDAASEAPRTRGRPQAKATPKDEQQGKE